MKGSVPVSEMLYCKEHKTMARIQKHAHVCFNAQRQALAENSFCSEDKQQGKTRRWNIKCKKKKATLLDLLIYQISPSTAGISHTKSVKMHGHKTGQYIKPGGHEL
jgi:hypothetical protein